jgi:hypothetical protein
VGDPCDVGGSHAETGLSDITLAWMMGKAKNLGVEFDAQVWASYSTLDPKHALDKKHDAWNLLWGFPKRRAIAATASLANSVAIRCAHDDGYRPSNLTLQKGVPAASCSIVPVVANPSERAEAARGQG